MYRFADDIFSCFPLSERNSFPKMSRSPKEAKLEVGQRTLSFFTQTREKTQEDTSTATEEDAYELDGDQYPSQ